MAERSVSLVEACDDPDLLGGVELWPTQRELLKGVDEHRVSAWAVGRRGGKSTCLAAIGVHACTLRPSLRRFLRDGERGYAVVIGVNVRQARLVLRAAREMVERSPLLGPLLVSASEDELVFRSDGNEMAFSAFPCTSRGARGWPIAALLLDEFAHHVDGEGNSAAESVWRALSPSVAQFGTEGRIIASSTPWGSEGAFATLHAQASSGEIPDAVAFQVSSEDANPTLDAAFMAAERARDPEAAKSEFDALFVAGGASFFDGDNLRAAVTLPGELRPRDATSWVAGLDPAFASDVFAVVLVGVDRRDRRRLLVGMVRGWLPPKRKAGSLDEARVIEDATLAEVASLVRTFKATAVTDQFKSAGVAERLRRLGVRVRVEPMTASSKDAAFGFLRGRLNDGSIELFEQADLLRELRAVRTRYAAGRSSVVLPRVGRGHCDHAQALAIAVHEIDRHHLGLPLKTTKPTHRMVDIGGAISRAARFSEHSPLSIGPRRGGRR